MQTFTYVVIAPATIHFGQMLSAPNTPEIIDTRKVKHAEIQLNQPINLQTPVKIAKKGATKEGAEKDPSLEADWDFVLVAVRITCIA